VRENPVVLFRGNSKRKKQMFLRYPRKKNYRRVGGEKKPVKSLKKVKTREKGTRKKV